MLRDRSQVQTMKAVIAARLAELGLSEPAACRAAGVGQEAIRNIKRGHMPGAETAAKLAKVLGLVDLQRAELVGPDTAPGAPISNGVTIISDLKLLRGRQSSAGGMTHDEPVAMVPRPPELAGRADAYAIYVDDALNEPWLREGHIAYVDPSRPIMPGAMVRLFPTGAAAYLCVLVGRSDSRLFVRVASETQPRQLTADSVVRMERVVSFTLLEG